MRGKQTPKRVVRPDEIYNSTVVTKFTNYLMFDGRKETARNIVYKAMEALGKNAKLPPVEALETAINNVKPKVEVRSKRVGGSNYQVPVPVPEGRQFALASRWIIEAARSGRGANEFWISLERELMNAFKKEGSAVKKKEEVRRMAEANKAFAQFA